MYLMDGAMADPLRPKTSDLPGKPWRCQPLSAIRDITFTGGPQQPSPSKPHRSREAGAWQPCLWDAHLVRGAGSTPGQT